MAHFLDGVLEAVNDELKESDLHPNNFYAQAKLAKRRISRALAANDVVGARSAAAAYGGVVKRWRRWLIENLTFVALSGVETSRAGVRKWQTEMFGHSIASSLLKQYGMADHSGGGRVGKIQLSDEIEREVRAFYKAYSKRIKAV
jgi:hypothetical protein